MTVRPSRGCFMSRKFSRKDAKPAGLQVNFFALFFASLRLCAKISSVF
jgi:hypothetical protein